MVSKPLNTRNHSFGLFVCFLVLSVPAPAQDWDIGARAVTAISGATDNKLKLTFEQRGRYEDHTGNTFGKDVDVATGLFRTRLGLNYTPVSWLKFSGMVQDSRAPWYGPGAPNTLRTLCASTRSAFTL